LLGVEVLRPTVSETTALGAAYLAGLAVGYWQDTSDLGKNWMLDRRFIPRARTTELTDGYARWQEAVRRTLGWASPQGSAARDSGLKDSG